MKDSLLEEFLAMKPDTDDDLFVFVIVVDDPEADDWELRRSFIGSYEKAAALCAHYLGQLVADGRLGSGGARIVLYSGAGVLAYLADIAKEESEYQRERRTNS